MAYYSFTRNYFAGRDDARAEREAEQQNALRAAQLERAQSVNALARDPNATPEQYIRAGDAATGNALAGLQAQRQVDQRQALDQVRQIGERAYQIAQTRGPEASKAFTRQALSLYGPYFEAAGANISQTLAQLGEMPNEQYLQSLEAFAPPPEKPMEVSPGASLVRSTPSGYESVFTAPPAPSKRTVVVGQYRPLSPEEVAAAGLPPGTSAQIDTTTGKIDVLSKPDTTGGLSQKDQTKARLKLNTVRLARQQLNNIRQRFEAIKGTLSAGPFGQGKVPSEAGRAFDRAVDQMRSTLTSLTRVPGVGAMSDYETRLDQAKFPTRNEYEAVTEQQINDLDDMLNAIERGYQDLLAGVTPGATAPAAPQAPPARTNSDAALSAPPPVNARGWRLMVDAQGNRAYVSPDGTQFEEVP